jgi:hypothetical protein
VALNWGLGCLSLFSLFLLFSLFSGFPLFFLPYFCIVVVLGLL